MEVIWDKNPNTSKAVIIIIKLHDNIQIERKHFTSSFSYFVIESYMEGNAYAEAYVDQLEHPQITVIWDGKHSIFCGGSADKNELEQAVGFIKQEILTQDVRRSSVVFKITYENNEWKEALLACMGELAPNIYPRSVYMHRLEHIPDYACKDNSIVIKKIDEEMVNNKDLKNLPGLVEELEQMWSTVGSFIAKGFGFCAIKDSSIAAWCTGEYFSKNWCGIGIETYEEYQRQGIATAATVELLKHCKVLGKTPHWDCWKNNTPSAKTAEKTGFDKLADYEIVFLRFT